MSEDDVDDVNPANFVARLLGYFFIIVNNYKDAVPL